MKSAIFTIILFATLCWVIYANVDLINTVSGLLDCVGSETAAKLEMGRLAGIVRDYYRKKRVLPVRNLKKVIAAHVGEGNEQTLADFIRDPWGTSYRLHPREQGFYVISAGPDKKWHTEDDIKHYQTMVDILSGTIVIQRPPTAQSQDSRR